MLNLQSPASLKRKISTSLTRCVPQQLGTMKMVYRLSRGMVIKTVSGFKGNPYISSKALKISNGFRKAKNLFFGQVLRRKNSKF